MTTREDIVTAARSWRNVPWVHQGRDSSGIDCVGLLVVVGRACGMGDADYTGYGRNPVDGELRRVLEKHFDRATCRNPGNVLLLKMDTVRHVAIRTPVGMIHAHAQVGKVAEHPLNEVWQSRIVREYSWRGLSDV